MEPNKKTYKYFTHGLCEFSSKDAVIGYCSSYRKITSFIFKYSIKWGDYLLCV